MDKEGTQWRQQNILDSNCYCYNREGEFLFGWIALWKSIYVGNRISWSLIVCCFSFDSSRQKQVYALIIYVNYTLINISICYLQCYMYMQKKFASFAAHSFLRILWSAHRILSRSMIGAEQLQDSTKPCCKKENVRHCLDCWMLSLVENC